MTNKPTVEIEKPIWRTESVLLATLSIKRFTVPEKKDKPVLLEFF